MAGQIQFYVYKESGQDKLYKLWRMLQAHARLPFLHEPLEVPQPPPYAVTTRVWVNGKRKAAVRYVPSDIESLPLFLKAVVLHRNHGLRFVVRNDASTEWLTKHLASCTEAEQKAILSVRGTKAIPDNCKWYHHRVVPETATAANLPPLRQGKNLRWDGVYVYVDGTRRQRMHLNEELRTAIPDLMLTRLNVPIYGRITAWCYALPRAATPDQKLDMLQAFFGKVLTLHLPAPLRITTRSDLTARTLRQFIDECDEASQAAVKALLEPGDRAADPVPGPPRPSLVVSAPVPSSAPVAMPVLDAVGDESED